MRRHLTTALTLAAASALALAGCSGATDEAETSTPAGGDSAATSDGSWPRTIEHEAGSAELDAEPLRIVSTSITLTGTLLAIDAPVVASAATSVSSITDENGFFSQWADVAVERGVEVLYPDPELDMEAIEVAEPDLIIGSTIGADATTDSYDQLSEIAPTIMLDYGSNTWEELATILGEATGHEEDAATLLSDYDA